MTNNINVKFTIRTETVKAWQDKEGLLTEVIRIFLGKTRYDARRLLWELTHGERLKETLEMLGLYPNEVSKLMKCEERTLLEMVRMLRNELRYQYELLYPTFLEPEEDSEAVKVAFGILRRSVNDPIVAYALYFGCKKRLWDVDSGKVSYLLASEKENLYAGALKELGFKSKAQLELVKPFHAKVLKLLEALWDDAMSQKEEVLEDEPETAQEEVEVKPEEEQVEAGIKAINADTILANWWDFYHFVIDGYADSFSKLAKDGFDLNEVIRRKEAIKNFVKAVLELERE